ncbi:inner nuclear membrane protein enriched at telomere/subtelomere region [Peltigera leucophlebia]|nr:inner nuclear membrane protein enriched at telomere/subtelomere region [Peltigera leucophlebia]
MASASDPEMEYLAPSFEPSSLTVPKLRAILVSHDIAYPASAKKPQLIDIFTQELVPRSRRILAARSRTQRTSRGITNMPSSREGTLDGDEDSDRNSMPPPPVPENTRRKSRKIVRDVSEGIPVKTPPIRRSASKRASGKHARPSDTETEPEPENKRPLARKTRRSDIISPTIKFEEYEESPARSSLGESAFSHDNVFQSGSSPPAPSESRRTSGGAIRERRKSSSRRRKTEGSVAEKTRIKQEDGVVVPSAETFETPVRRRPKSQVKDEPEDGVGIGEEFTPEEQLELVRERAANGDRDLLPPRRKRARKSSSVPKSAPWVVLMALLSGYALWWRREKLEVGYCGIGRPSISFENYQVPEWVISLQPQCEPCPQHAICYKGMKTKCEQDFILQPHPLSLAGIVPLPPTCEPDGEKVRRVKIVADKAIEELRERNADWECGTLLDEQGKHVGAVELDEKLLKEHVGRKRKRGMTDAEFEDLWKGALGEIKDREEVVHHVDEYDSAFLLLLASAPLLQLSLLQSGSFLDFYTKYSTGIHGSNQKSDTFPQLTRSLTLSTDAPPTSYSPAPLSTAYPSAAPSEDPSASRWRAIESSLLAL